MRFRCHLAAFAVVAIGVVACSDSKADLKTGTYSVRSDCIGASQSGNVTLAQESPNVYRATGATSFGFPDELVHREDQGRLQSSGETRICRARAYVSESEIMFVCVAAASSHPECTLLLKRD
jgi:hypothetical protein